MTRRLWLAYLIAPWGAVTPLLLLWLGFEVWARVEHWHYDLFITTPRHFAALVGIAYVVGAALLPAYFVFERRGWRGWKYYVPTAILAAFLAELAIDAATTSWANRRRQRSIRAACSGRCGQWNRVRRDLLDRDAARTHQAELKFGPTTDRPRPSLLHGES